MVRPTEENNALSANIDVLDLDDMGNVFAKVDHQLFEPWSGAEDYTFGTQSDNIEQLAKAIHDAIVNKRTIVRNIKRRQQRDNLERRNRRQRRSGS